MASIDRRSGAFRVRWVLGGKRGGAAQSLTCPDLNSAQRVKLEAERLGHNVSAVDLARAMQPADSSAEGGVTVAQWVTRHVASIEDVLSAGTRAEYARSIRIHLEPSTLGGMMLTGVTREHVQRWVGELVRKPLAAKSVANHHALLAGALQAAVDQQVMPHNPCRGVSLPRADAHIHETAHYLTAQQVDTLSRSVKPYGPLVVTLARTGLRWGEATALQVADVDLLAKPPSLRVERAWNRETSAGRHLGPPKTPRSRRTVSLDSATVDALLPLLAGRAGDEWVFTANDGLSPLPRTTFRTRWVTAITELGVAARIHDLRHTHASWLIQAGVPLPVIQRRLGHESITTTIDLYGHLAPDADVAVMSALNGLGSFALPVPADLGL